MNQFSDKTLKESQKNLTRIAQNGGGYCSPSREPHEQSEKIRNVVLLGLVKNIIPQREF